MTNAKIPIFRRSNQSIKEQWMPPPPPPREYMKSRSSFTMSMGINTGTGNSGAGSPEHSPQYTAEHTPVSVTSSHFATDAFNDVKSDSEHAMSPNCDDGDTDDSLSQVADMFIKYSGLQFDPDESDGHSKTPFLSPVESSHNSHPPIAHIRNIDLRRLTLQSMRSIRSLLPRSRASSAQSLRQQLSHPNLRGGPGAYAQLDVVDDIHHPMPELTFAYAPKKADSPPHGPKVMHSGSWDGKTVVRDADEPTFSESTTMNDHAPHDKPPDVKSNSEDEWKLDTLDWPVPPAPVVMPIFHPSQSGQVHSSSHLPANGGRRTHVKKPSYGPREVKLSTHNRNTSESRSDLGVSGGAEV